MLTRARRRRGVDPAHVGASLPSSARRTALRVHQPNQKDIHLACEGFTKIREV
jgi:hypothetical protein